MQTLTVWRAALDSSYDSVAFPFLTLPMTHEGEVARLINIFTVMSSSRGRGAGYSTSKSWKSLWQGEPLRSLPGTSSESGPYFMCFSLVKLMAVVLNIAGARRIWLQMCYGLYQKMEGISMLETVLHPPTWFASPWMQNQNF